MPRLSAKMKKLLEDTMRTDIMDASVEIIIADGVEGLTTDKLAKRLEVSRGTLYNYFPSKEDIIKSVCERNFKAFLAAIDEIAQSDEAPDVKLYQVAEYMIRDFESQRKLHSALMASPPPKRSPDFVDGHKLLMDKIGGIIKHGVKAKKLKANKPEIVAAIFFGALRELCFSNTLGVLDAPPEQLLASFKTTVIAALKA